MKLVVFSDSHGCAFRLRTVMKQNPAADMYIHLGDGEDDYERITMEFAGKNFRYVCGNCDSGVYTSKQVIKACGFSIFACHGHRYGVKSGRDALAEQARAAGCQIAIYGHTHIKKLEQIDGIYVFCPGGAAVSGDGAPPSYGVITLKEGKEPLFEFFDINEVL